MSTDIVRTIVAQYRNDTTGAHVAVVKTVTGGRRQVIGVPVETAFTVACEACGPVGLQSSRQDGVDEQAHRHSQSCVKLPPRLWVDMDQAANR